MDIVDVIEGIKAGDRAAFAPMVARYEGPQFGFLGRLGLEQAEAEEIAQETFLRAWTKIGS